MFLLFAEMLLALSIIVFIMWWTLKGADQPAQPIPPINADTRANSTSTNNTKQSTNEAQGTPSTTPLE